MQRVRVESIPLWWYCLGNVPQDLKSNLGFKFGQPRLEGFNSSHLFVNYFPRVKIPSGRIWKIPFSRVEAEALIDHPHLVRGHAIVATKDDLPTVGVTRPAIKDEHAKKIAQIAGSQHLFVGKQVVHSQVMGVSRVTRPELEPGLARNACPLRLHV